MTAEPDGHRPGIPDQRATIAATRVILDGGDLDAAHAAAEAAGPTCPACATVVAASFTITVAQELAGAGFVAGPLRGRLAAVLDEIERELRGGAN